MNVSQRGKKSLDGRSSSILSIRWTTKQLPPSFVRFHRRQWQTMPHSVPRLMQRLSYVCCQSDSTHVVYDRGTYVLARATQHRSVFDAQSPYDAVVQTLRQY